MNAAQSWQGFLAWQVCSLLAHRPSSVGSGKTLWKVGQLQLVHDHD